MLYNANVYPKTWRGIIMIMLATLLLILNVIVYFIWRNDKPHGNPGGPLVGMSVWVNIWGALCDVSALVIVPLIFKSVRVVREQARLVQEGRISVSEK